jgi:hypothetical protein
MRTDVRPNSQDLSAYPLLRRLGLSDQELDALRRQGFISREMRGRKTVYRLRYRVDGRVRVRYVRPEDAESVEAELALWQRRMRSRRRLRWLAVAARRELRQQKILRTPLLAERGYHFHGYAVRRCRGSKGA